MYSFLGQVGLEQLEVLALHGAASHIPTSRFSDITNLLKHLDTDWAYRPKLFMVLRWIGKVNSINLLVNKGLTDYDLPFTELSFPEELESSWLQFERLQEYVLTSAKDIELGKDGKYVSLNSGEDHFIRQRYLGSGGSGDVQQVLSHLSHRCYALKRFRRHGTQREMSEQTTQFIREVKTMKRLKHVHLVRVMGSYTDKSYFAILMQPIADCNLLTYLDTMSEADFPTLRSFFRCLASTIAYLHAHQIHHMDIKPENILIKGSDLLVADFGSSHDWSRKERSTTWTQGPRTERYAPPEVVKDFYAPRNFATDIRSLGVVFLDMSSALRGYSVDSFRAFLLKNGTSHKYVWGNPSGTAKWTERLRQGTGPESDNEPLIWIQDMLRRQPGERLAVASLVRQILQSSSAERFRRICCADPDDQLEDLTNDDASDAAETEIVEDVEEDWAALLAPAHHKAHTRSSTKSHSIQAWLERNDTVHLEPIGEQNSDMIVPTLFHDEEELAYTIEEEDELADTREEVKSDSKKAVLETPLCSPATFGYGWNLDFLKAEIAVPDIRENWKDYLQSEPEELAYDIIEDAWDSEVSEETVRPFDCAYSIIAESEDDEFVPGDTVDHSVDTSQGPLLKVEFSKTAPVLSREWPEPTTLEEPGVQPFFTVDIPVSSMNVPEALNTGISGLDRSTEVSNIEQEHHFLLPPRQLTIENLESPDVSLKDEKGINNRTDLPEIVAKASNAHKKKSRRGRTRRPLFSAVQYMNQVWKAESSAATSVLSENTEAKLRGLLSLPKWQDQSQRCVESFAKQGNSAAVHRLLEMSCNPGTKVLLLPNHTTEIYLSFVGKTQTRSYHSCGTWWN